MRWKVAPRPPENTWFKWWAWYPVFTEQNEGVWLEEVWVKGKYYGYTGDWEWTYKSMQPEKR